MNRSLDGIIIINKEKNCTSHDVVYKIRKLFNEKVGHTGTLDPMARGVLPILVGKGTLCSKYLVNHDKVYEAVIKLGERRDTADVEGTVIETKHVIDVMMEEENIKRVLSKFVGKQDQIPPMFSAIKVRGKKLYEYARKGEKVEVQPRKIEIYSINLINIDKENKQLRFKVGCSKGTYIRTLCENIAEDLGTVGYMLDLNRLKVGNFGIENSVKIDELENNKDNELFLRENLISIEELFSGLNSIVLPKRKVDLLLNGVCLSYNVEDGVYRLYSKMSENGNSTFIGIGIVKSGLLKRDIIVIDKQDINND